MPTLEAQIVDSLINNPNNTDNSVVCNSVGKVLLKLRRIYFDVPPSDAKKKIEYENKMNLACDGCKQEWENIINTTQDESIKSALQFLVGKIAEPADTLDRVTLYLPKEDGTGYESQIYLFPLKEVAMLVWKALHDHAKYAHHHNNMDHAKELAARLRNFYDCLNDLKSNRACHQGNRNEMVFLLNETYYGIKLIEDVRASIHCFLKDGISDLFWKQYNGTPNKKLIEALFFWMSDRNITQLLFLIDPNKSIIQKIHAFIIENASDPQEIKLDELIEQAIAHLEFFCDSEKHAQLGELHAILCASEQNEDADSSKALQKIQTWIKENYQFENNQHQQIIHQFNILYLAYHHLKKYHFVLKLAEKMEANFDDFEKYCELYFQSAATNIFSNIPAEILNIAVLINENIKKANQDPFFNQIENFFAVWFEADREGKNETIKHLYYMLLEDVTRKKILLTDQRIKEFLSGGALEKEITPYEINRVFLHAILVEPEEWTDLFTQAFDAVFAFVQNNFNQSDLPNAGDLKNASYPEKLIKQLAYLQARKKYQDCARPDNLPILLPFQVKHAYEWIVISLMYLYENRVEAYYTPMANAIKKMLMLDINKLHQELEVIYPGAFKFFIAAIKSIPEKKRYAFIKTLKPETIRKFVANDLERLGQVLFHLPTEDKVLFLVDILKVAAVKEMIGISDTDSTHNANNSAFIAYKLISILGFLSNAKDRVIFLEALKLRNIDIMLVQSVLHVLSEDERLLFLKTLDKDLFVKNVIHIKTLFLSQKDQGRLILSLGADNLKSLVIKGRAGILLLGLEPNEMREFFGCLERNIIKEHIIRNLYDVYSYLTRFPDDQKCRFIDILGSELLQSYVNQGLREPRAIYQEDYNKMIGSFYNIVAVLPNNIKSSFFSYVGMEAICKVIKNKNDFKKEVAFLPEAERSLHVEEFIKQASLYKLDTFANQLEKEYKKKHSIFGFFCPATKKEKAVHLRRLIGAIKQCKFGEDTWREVVRNALAVEQKRYNITHRTRNLLQNILNDAPEKNILNPKTTNETKIDHQTIKPQRPRFW